MDAHINDPEFAVAMAKQLLVMIDGPSSRM